MYDKFGFRDLSDNSSLETTASSAEDLIIVHIVLYPISVYEISKTPLLESTPRSSAGAYGTTSTGRSDEFYTTDDYDADNADNPSTSLCILRGRGNQCGQRLGDWYLSDAAGTVVSWSSFTR